MQMQLPQVAAFVLVVLLRPGGSSALASSTTWSGGNSALAADELTLLSVKSALSDPAGLLASWNASNRLCSWRGVGCGRRHPRRVVALLLDSFGLGGQISPFLGNLSFLKSLDLGNNSLVGRIPWQLGRLGHLHVLNLSVNSLQGDIPTALGRCIQLRTLSLEANHLHGEIPSEVGSLKNLVYLNLATNNLTGQIPTSLGNLSSIQDLYLGFNKLSGAIPSSLGELPNLSGLFLTFNNLSGSIPHALWNASSLTMISMYGNDLSGTISPNAFDGLPHLQMLYIGKNQFHGPIPSSIANASKLLSLEAQRNYFSGIVPTGLGGLKGLQKLVLYSNSLEASGPKDWIFFTALTNCTQLQRLDLGTNQFVGEFPSSVSNLSASLELLDLRENTFSGAIPENIGNLINLEGLVLQSNNLNGLLPSSLRMLHNLQYISLAGNNLHGDIRSFGNLTQLVYLYIGYNSFNGTIPTTLGKLGSLVEFDLSNCYFTGGIPTSLLKIPSLAHELHLSHNLLEGPVPFEIGNLKSVSILHAESNRLSGELPSTLGECQLLQNLHLQNNFLRGTLPQLLSRLKNLEILDISNNNFSGQIPKFLGNMSALLYLNLSFNNFVGELPTFSVFSNASAFSIHGNGNLCGGIFELHLPPCSFELPKEKRKVLVIPLVVSLIATISIVLFFYSFLVWNKKRSTGSPSTTHMNKGFPQLGYCQLVKATDGFAASNLLGAGAFGSVYKGKLDEDSDETAIFVAIKVLKLRIPGASKSFVAECDTMRNIRHRNLVRIITACSSIDSNGDDFKAIVFEFMPNGSIEDWIHPGTNDQSGERQLSLPQRVDILLDVAYALDYLHFNGATPIVHCDLKPSNVLLDADMVAHVGDFGLARILAEGCSSFQITTSSVGFRGTVGYAPPG
ncbi:hypothetical protein QOZ80_2AG0138530 [Eleusine coracana subsp. coracana]|nr:hypothetical protein QOZ80_2AG0138530 [Eleusine coracana subsp. coracana]